MCLTRPPVGCCTALRLPATITVPETPTPLSSGASPAHRRKPTKPSSTSPSRAGKNASRPVPAPRRRHRLRATAPARSSRRSSRHTADRHPRSRPVAETERRRRPCRRRGRSGRRRGAGKHLGGRAETLQASAMQQQQLVGQRQHRRLWVTSARLLPCRRIAAMASARAASPASSRLALGSSSTISAGRPYSARARPMRWRWPPESPAPPSPRRVS